MSRIGNLQDLLSGGAMAATAWFFGSQVSPFERRDLLRARYPGSHGQTISALLERMRSAHDAGLHLETTHSYSGMGRIPLDPTLPRGTGFRYHVTVLYYDPAQRDAEPEHRIALVDSDRILSIEELRDQADSQLRPAGGISSPRLAGRSLSTASVSVGYILQSL